MTLLEQHINAISLSRNILLLHELGGILADCNQHGIPSIVLKGAAYLNSIYTASCQRHMTDVDILINKNAARDVHGLFARRGYKPMPHGRSFIKSGLVPLMIDVHARFWYDPRPHIPWQQSIPCLIEGQKTRILNAEEMILFHVAHGCFKHDEWEEKASIDLKQMLAVFNGSIRWDILAQRAHETRLLIPLIEVLRHVGAITAAQRLQYGMVPRGQWMGLVFSRAIRRFLSARQPIPYVDYILPLFVRPGYARDQFLDAPASQTISLKRLLTLAVKTILGIKNILFFG